MNLSEILYPFRRWWWLLVLTTLIATMSSYFVVRNKPPIYKTSVTLMVGQAIDNLNPNNNDFWLSQQLAGIYATIAARDPVRSNTMAALGLNQLPEYLAQPVPNSQFLEISVTDVNPERAQRVANELAKQLILQSPSGSQLTDPERQAFTNQQLKDLQTSIDQTQKEIASTQDGLGKLNSAVQIADTQQQILALQQKLSLLQTNYTTLLNSTQNGATNTLKVVEPASIPTTPIGPNKKGMIALAGAIGLVLAASASHLLEYLDTTLKTVKDIERVLQLSVIGFIADMKDEKEAWSYVTRYPRSPITEAFRSLRANIEFAGVDYPLRSILLISPDSSEGKSTVASNLAFVMAQGENRVVLMDADLRRPIIHRFLGVQSQPGLSDVFSDRVSLLDALQTWKDKNIGVITGGSPLVDSMEVVGSRKMDQILDNLEDVADMIIIDGPPAYVIDAMILAAKVDGVLMVIRPGHTREDAARAMLEQIERTGARVLGVVFNRISRRSAVSYGGYRYYSPRYGDSEYFAEKPGKSNVKGDRSVDSMNNGKLHNPSDSVVKKIFP
jgi:succinoglycan biosynthesis transport protein ExoP